MKIFTKTRLEFLFISASLFVACSTAIASNLPKLDVEGTCRNEPKLLPEDPDPYPECISEERAAREQLQKAWGTFNARQREECIETTHIGGAPSYVDVLGCLQIAQ